MNRVTQFSARTACAAVLVGACGIAGAGSLEPPPGVIKPTMKTLDQVEARKPIHQSDLPMSISVDGAYYLAENLYAPLNGVDMITVFATHASIDLNGFTIHGTSQVAQAADCIQIEASVRSFALSNGVIRECGGNGVVSDGGNDLSVSVSRVHANQNGGSGIQFGVGASGVVSESVARNNGVRGILLYEGIIEDSVTVGNTGVGVQTTSGLIRGCMSKLNGVANLFGGGMVADTYAP